MNKEDYAKYLQTEHWREVRDRALEYAERRCQLCYSATNVQVHHRTYDRVGHERPADLTVLCQLCHEKHHDRDKRGGIYMYQADPRSRAHRDWLYAQVDKEE